MEVAERTGWMYSTYTCITEAEVEIYSFRLPCSCFIASFTMICHRRLCEVSRRRTVTMLVERDGECGRHGRVLPGAFQLPVSSDLHVCVLLGPPGPYTSVFLRRGRGTGYVCGHPGQRGNWEFQDGEWVSTRREGADRCLESTRRTGDACASLDPTRPSASFAWLLHCPPAELRNISRG